MSGIAWYIFVFLAVAVFLSVIIYRALAIRRLPVHLRWELAPIPRRKPEREYAWRRRPFSHPGIAPLAYMAWEVLLLRGVWRNNRGLWPLSLALHLGLYLVILAVLFQFINALRIIGEVPPGALDVDLGVAAGIAAAGYLLGAAGAAGLILKRALDAGYRPFTTPGAYFRLVFLAALFGSGIYAWLASPWFAFETSMFIRGVLTLDAGQMVSAPLAAHLVVLLLFLAYLPFTDMIHFVAKYFTYHGVRWNDTPKNAGMEAELARLLAQPVTWSAGHVGAGGGRRWLDLAAGDRADDEKPQA